jgi:methylmalonyl-CoA epimerase
MASTESDEIATEASLGAKAGLLTEITELDHIALAVEDLESAVKWYVRCLGFKVLERRTTRGARTAMHSAVLQAGRAVVVLTQGTSPDSQISQFIQRFGAGVTHVAFAVKNIDETIARLEANGGAVETPLMEDAGIRQTFLRRDERTGVRIELIEKNGGQFTDSSVDRLFRNFERLGLY